MKIHAPMPQNKPVDSAILPLSPVDLGGYKFYGWKIVPTKSFDSGQKDKQTGDEKVGQQLDDSASPVYDTTTALLMAGKLNNPVIAKMAVDNAQNTATISKLLEKVAELQLDVKKANGGK